MAQDFVAIEKNPWKINQTLNGYGPVCSLVSLYDLIYNSDDDTESYDSLRVNSSGTLIKGLKLDHDIICFNATVYANDGSVIKTNKGNFFNYGLDICPALFDPAAKAHVLDYHAIPGITSSLKVYDKKAALYPSSTLAFEGFPWNSVDPDFTSELPYNPVSVGRGGPGISLPTTFQLGETDPVFNATIKQDGLESFTRIALNPNNSKTWQIVKYFLPVLPDGSSQAHTLWLSQYKHLLKYCYVWIKLRYFADYISQESFTQDLTPASDVQHRNINISASGDFNRYERKVASVSGSNAEAHRPYIPKTVPSLDLLSNQIYPGYAYNDDSSVQATITEVLEKTSFTDNDSSAIGQLQTTPVNSLFTDAEGTPNEPTDHSLDSLTHPGYFDPESRLSPLEYDQKPVLVPKDGNLITDGRIMSPTIDELWVYIKLLTDGRLNDDTITPSDVSRPKSTTLKRKITEDLLPIAPKNFTISDKANIERTGDPLETTIINTDNSTIRPKLVVSSYINAPEGLSLSQYTQLKLISDAIIGSTGKSAHSLASLAPWQQNPTNYTEVSDSNPIQPGIVNTEALQTDATWGPRANPLSLREVEALLKQSKLSMISLARFMKENLAVSGGLGRELNIEDPVNKARGSLYQMHKDYNFKVDNPNTVFGAVDGKVTLPIGETLLSDGSIVGKSKTVNNDYYGQSSEIPTSRNGQSSSEVFLAADGTWRSLWAHVRLPIVSEEF